KFGVRGNFHSRNKIILPAVLVLIIFVCMVGVVALPGAVSAAAVTLNPGDNVQSAVDANPAGSTFLLNAGVYRMQSIVPKDGDIFLGSFDSNGNRTSILNGSRLLTTFSRSGNYWV